MGGFGPSKAGGTELHAVPAGVPIPEAILQQFSAAYTAEGQGLTQMVRRIVKWPRLSEPVVQRGVVWYG